MADAASTAATVTSYKIAAAVYNKSIEHLKAAQVIHDEQCIGRAKCVAECRMEAACVRAQADMVVALHMKDRANRTITRPREASVKLTPTPTSTSLTTDQCGSSPKKCSCCQRYRPANRFSGAQLKRQGKRQCHDCLIVVCAVCGSTELAARPETKLKNLRIQRPSPATDLMIKAHLTCALVLGYDITQRLDTPRIDDLPDSVCQVLNSQCNRCLRDGAPVQCARCQRVYHTRCVGVKLEDSVFPVIVNNCNHGDCAVAHDVQSAEQSKAASISVETSPVAYKPQHTGLFTPVPRELLVAGFAPLFSIPAATQPVSSPLKRCSLCRRDHPESSYSHAQLGRQDADKKRRCKRCITAMQRLNPDARLIDISERLLMTGTSESQQMTDLGDLTNLLHEMCKEGLTMAVPEAVVVRIIRATKPPQRADLCNKAATCIISLCYMAHLNPVLTSTLISAGVFSPIIVMLKGCTIHRDDATSTCVLEALARIGTGLLEGDDAMEPTFYCDEILAGGALPMILALFTSATTSKIWEASSLILIRLLRSHPPDHAQVQTIMPHLCGMIMTADNPADLRCVCLRVLGYVVFYCQTDDRSAWIEVILRTVPGFTQRLIELLDDSSADVREATVALLCKMNERPDDLAGLVKNGLIGRLLPLFSDSPSRACHLHTMLLCRGIARCVETARALVAESQLIQRLLELVRTPSSPWRLGTIDVLVSVLEHKDHAMASQLVASKVLNTLIPVLKEVCDLGNMEVAATIMRALLWLLQTGEAEQHNNHDINPYNEPIDWLGAFELVEPLRRHQVAWLAQLAEDIFAYFIPNDCE